VSEQHVQAAHSKWAKTIDRRAATAAARKAFLAKLDATIPAEITGLQREKALRNAILAHYAGIRARKAKLAREREAAEMRRIVDACVETGPGGIDPAA